MKHGHWYLALALALAGIGPLAGATGFYTASSDIRLEGRQLVGILPTDTEATEAGFEIDQEEGCTYRITSPSRLNLTGPCHYLGGVYRYQYLSREDGAQHLVAQGFVLSSEPSDSHILMVSEPLELRPPRVR
jgi:hypothetical protein